MKILIIGANGVIGSHLSRTFSTDHEVIRASANNSEYTVDFSSGDSLRSFFEEVGEFDALITAAGSAPMKPLHEMTYDDFLTGFNSKMMGQINAVLIGQEYINLGGSFTLTSGILAKDPIPKGSGLSTVNAAVNGFVLAASRELIPKNLRLNVVSPGLLEDSAERLADAFPGHFPVPSSRVIKAYEKSLFGNGTGEIIEVF